MGSSYDTIYFDPRVYDAMFYHAKDDVAFWAELAKQYPGPVLELACGTGRITIPLTQQIGDVTGIDISEGMLEQARKNADAERTEVKLVCGDVRDFDLGQKFSFIFYPLNSIAHLHDNASISACLDCVKNHLTEDGRLALQMFNPLPRVFTRDPSQRFPLMEYKDPDGRGNVVVTESNIYDRASQINHINWFFTYEDGEEIVAELPMRIYYPQELDMLLRFNGLEIESKYGDYDMSPFASESPRQIVVCRCR